MGSRERPQPSAVAPQPGASGRLSLLYALPPTAHLAPLRPSLHTMGARPFICAGPGNVTQSCNAVIVPNMAGW